MAPFLSRAIRKSFSAAPAAAIIILGGAIANLATTSHAAFHYWEVTEVFSNADGTVQFIEMFDPRSGENYVQGYGLEATFDAGSNSYGFPTNILPLSADTANKHLLIATPGFQAISGVAPDFELPPGPFFDPTATSISIEFNGSFSLLGVDDGSFPIDGVHSLTDAGLGLNSPTNFSGAVGSVNLSGPQTTGDYNHNEFVDAADYPLWRKTLNSTADPHGSGADGDSDGTIGPGDYDFWRLHFGEHVATGTGLGTGAVPEPIFGAFVGLGLLALGFLRCRRNRLS